MLSHIRAKKLLPAPTAVITNDPASAHGSARRGVADGTISAFDVVYESGTSNGQTKFKRADADAAASVKPPLYIALCGASSGGAVDVSSGPVTVAMDTTGASQGDYVYVSGTAGGKSLTAGTYAQIIGVVRTHNSTSGDFTFDGSLASTSVAGSGLAWPDGTAAAPGLPKVTDPDTGLYGLEANAIGMASGGAALLGFKGGGAPTIAAATDTAGAAVYISAPAAGGTATAARTGGSLNIAAGAGSAGSAAIAGGNGGSLSESAGAGGAKSGTGSAAGGNGGAMARNGGAGGATASTGTGAGGNGGAISDTAGAGGAATGAGSTGNGGTGGIMSRTAGAGGATVGGTAGAGGTITDTGGAGAAQANAVAGGVGGPVSYIGGAGGANTGGATGQAGGAGGAANVTGGVGGATNSTGAHAGGAGGKVLLTGGAGGAASAGTGNGGNGGDVDLVPGAGGTSAGGTAGVKGQVKINGTAGIFEVPFRYGPTPIDEAFCVVNRPHRVIGIRYRVSVVGSDVGAVTAEIRKAASTVAPSGGTILHTGTMNLKNTVDTVASLTLSSTSADLDLAAGDSLVMDCTGTTTDARGVVTVLLVPI